MRVFVTGVKRPRATAHDYRSCSSFETILHDMPDGVGEPQAAAERIGISHTLRTRRRWTRPSLPGWRCESTADARLPVGRHPDKSQWPEPCPHVGLKIIAMPVEATVQ